MALLVCMSSDDALYFHDAERFSHKITIVEFQRGITSKMYRQELQFLVCAHLLMMLYISMKFHENILRGFQVTERHKMTIIKFQRGITTKLHRQELQFLYSACRLLMLYIAIKFHENILKGFQVIEQTRNDHCQISKANNYKTV